MLADQLQAPAGTSCRHLKAPPVGTSLTCRAFTCAGTLLRSVSFPVPLHSVLLGPGEHALYAGGADGRIFELPLAGQPVQAAASSGSGIGGEDSLPGARGWVALEGHSRTVTCLEATTDGGYMLSGELSTAHLIRKGQGASCMLAKHILPFMPHPARNLQAVLRTAAKK